METPTVEKLTLKELAPYLPFGLNMIFEKSGRIITVAGLYDNQVIDAGSGTYYDLSIWGFKPLLRPLSQLTEEIVHNGERFVPFEEIAKIEAPNIVGAKDKLSNITAFTRGLSFSSIQQGVLYNYEGVQVEITRFKDCIFHKKVVDGNNSWVFSYFHNYPLIIQKLYEWHFDVHNLIPRGLAIDLSSKQ